MAAIHLVIGGTERFTAAFVVRKQGQYHFESYKHCLPCYPTMSAQKCPWHPPGSQVAGGAGQKQEA